MKTRLERVRDQAMALTGASMITPAVVRNSIYTRPSTRAITATTAAPGAGVLLSSIWRSSSEAA